MYKKNGYVKNGMSFAKANNQHINRYKMAHCVGVAEYMRDNADKYSLNKDEMYVLGLLHDIGYLNGRKNHEENGYELLECMGLNRRCLFAVKNHSADPYELMINDEYKKFILDACEDIVVSSCGRNDGCFIKQPIPREVEDNYIPKELCLLYEADLSVDARGYRVGFEKRLEDIRTRYGNDGIEYNRAKTIVQFLNEQKQMSEIPNELENFSIDEER